MQMRTNARNPSPGLFNLDAAGRKQIVLSHGKETEELGCQIDSSLQSHLRQELENQSFIRNLQQTQQTGTSPRHENDTFHRDNNVTSFNHTTKESVGSSSNDQHRFNRGAFKVVSANQVNQGLSTSRTTKVKCKLLEDELDRKKLGATKPRDVQ